MRALLLRVRRRFQYLCQIKVKITDAGGNLGARNF